MGDAESRLLRQQTREVRKEPPLRCRFLRAAASADPGPRAPRAPSPEPRAPRAASPEPRAPATRRRHERGARRPESEREGSPRPAEPSAAERGAAAAPGPEQQLLLRSLQNAGTRLLGQPIPKALCSLMSSLGQTRNEMPAAAKLECTE
ncbi:hypothetical protein VULLAG_LOCUS2806 [Vulpes lagopus]